MRKLSVSVLFILAIYSQISCGGAGERDNPFDPVNINVTLNKTTTTILAGNTEQLKATINPSDSSSQSMSWSSSDTTIATVTSDGIVKGLTAGKAAVYLTVTDMNKSAVCYVNVTGSSVTVKGVSLNKVEANLIPGGTLQLAPTINPLNATNQNVTWSSSNESIATVDSSGIVTGVAKGKAKIYATTADGGKQATCYIYVKQDAVQVTGITFSITGTITATGLTVQLNPLITPIDTTNHHVIWTSSDENVAIVSTTGNVYGIKEGSAVITASVQSTSKSIFKAATDYTATCTVNVTDTSVSVTGVTLDQSSATLHMENGLQLTETLTPSGSTNRNIFWTSSNPSVAAVSSSGYVYGVAPGDATITVTTDDGSYTDASTISVILTWTQATSSAGWSARFGHTSVVFDNKIWLIGGSSGTGNDIWYSEDGSTWTEAISSASWNSRYNHTSVVFDNKMWVIGGLDLAILAYYDDIWYSEDGITWTEATSSAPFGIRFGHTSVVYDNKIWVIGGCDDGGILKNDVWYSEDGVTWIEATASAAWSARRRHTSVVFDNKMWVIGGNDSSGRLCDVWFSDDGVTWTQATSSAGFSKRDASTCVVLNNKIWILGGYNGGASNDIWYSSDGITWSLATSAANWAGRYHHTSIVFDNKFWVIGGYNGSTYYNDVWYGE